MASPSPTRSSARDRSTWCGCPGWVSHLELLWEEPTLARFFERLASFSRLILFDKRGTGLSDRVAEPAADARGPHGRRPLRVDAVGSARPALLGVSEGGADVHPVRRHPPGADARDRSCWRASRARPRAPDYPWAATPESRAGVLDEIERDWGGPVGLEHARPKPAADDARSGRTGRATCGTRRQPRGRARALRA